MGGLDMTTDGVKNFKIKIIITSIYIYNLLILQ